VWQLQVGYEFRVCRNITRDLVLYETANWCCCTCVDCWCSTWRLPGFRVDLGREYSLLYLLMPLVVCAGVVTEYLRFGQAEGGVGDLAQLDRLMRALQVCGKWGMVCEGYVVATCSPNSV
jgi:hypothetical protein